MGQVTPIKSQGCLPNPDQGAPKGSVSLDTGKPVIFRDKRQSLQVGAWGSARARPPTGGHGKEVGEVGRRELGVGFPSPKERMFPGTDTATWVSYEAGWGYGGSGAGVHFPPSL